MAGILDPTWDGTPHWEEEPEVAEKYILYLDKSVEAALPNGSVFQSIVPHGASFWTVFLDTNSPNNGQTRPEPCVVLPQSQPAVSNFSGQLLATGRHESIHTHTLSRVSIGDPGRGMMHGDFVSMTKLHETSPDFTPTPLAWGTYKSDPTVHFFLCSFHDMDDQPFSLEASAASVAELHINGVSPSGKFGFPVATSQGRLPQDPTETDTWECFANNIKIMFDHELAAQGPDEEIAQLREVIMANVIPRLLRPLEVAGRQLVPRLVHGDLWKGNIGRIERQGSSWFLTLVAYEMAPWRPVRQRMGDLYVKAYQEYFPASEPAEDFDGRNLLYALRFNICSSALYPGNLNYRNVMRLDMREVVGRYGEGYEAWAERAGL